MRLTTACYLGGVLLLAAVPIPALAQTESPSPVDVQAAVLREVLSPDRMATLRSGRYGGYVCVGLRRFDGYVDPDTALLELFEGSDPPLVPISECRLISIEEYLSAPDQWRTTTHHRPTDSPAVRIVLESPEWDGSDAATVSVSYVVHPRHGEQHRCEVSEEAGGWTATCRVIGVS